MPWTGNDLALIPVGDGFRYELHERPFIISARCRLCRDFGAYEDTGICDDCEQWVLLNAEPIRGAREKAGLLDPNHPS
jgi:hypothetical protein